MSKSEYEDFVRNNLGYMNYVFGTFQENMERYSGIDRRCHICGNVIKEIGDSEIGHSSDCKLVEIP